MFDSCISRKICSGLMFDFRGSESISPLPMFTCESKTRKVGKRVICLFMQSYVKSQPKAQSDLGELYVCLDMIRQANWLFRN
jgi:hypothetical protein